MTVAALLEKPLMRIGPVPCFKTLDFPSPADRKKRLRYFGSADGNVLPWVSLNPSGKLDDGRGPTGKRIFEFAWRWGFDAVAVYNLYPFPTPNPDGIAHLALGNEEQIEANHSFIATELGQSDAMVVAWGSPPRNIRKHTDSIAQRLVDSINAVDRRTNPIQLWALGTTMKGYPRHPSPLGQVRMDTKPVRWSVL